MVEIQVKTLAEMARDTARVEASAGGRGIACPHCGCYDTRVHTTRREQGMIIRYRKCRLCGANLSPTIES